MTLLSEYTPDRIDLSTSEIGLISLKSGFDETELQLTEDSIHMKNAEGHSAVTINSIRGFGRIDVYNEKNTRVVSLDSFRGGGSLDVYNEQGAFVVSLDSFGGDGSLSVNDRGGKLMANLNAYDGGSLSLYNPKGGERASLYVNTNDHAGLWLYDKYGEESRAYTFY